MALMVKKFVLKENGVASAPLFEPIRGERAPMSDSLRTFCG